MSDDKNLSDDFIVSSKLSEEQKRRLDIRLTKDPDKRAQLETMVRYRDDQVSREEARLTEERKKLVAEQVRKANQPRAGQDGPTPPPGAVQETPEQRAERLEKQYDEHQKLKDDEKLGRLRGDLNQSIDQEIKQAKGESAGKGIRRWANR